jgi:hypothetical protein
MLRLSSTATATKSRSLVHLGGGVSAHIKLIGSFFFDWIEAGKQVYTDQDRLLFASDEPCGDHVGELPGSQRSGR